MKKYKISPLIISAESEDDIIILQLESGEYYGLENVGSYIWGLLEREPRTIVDVKTKVMSRFDIEDTICEQDVSILIRELMAENLIEEVIEV